MGIYVDGVMQTEWTSSGTTAGFENVDIDVSGEVVELRGVLADSEWISIMEVGAERTPGAKPFFLMFTVDHSPPSRQLFWAQGFLAVSRETRDFTLY